MFAHELVASTLFGAAREMIRAATGRGPNGPVIIPSTNFLPQAKELDGDNTEKRSSSGEELDKALAGKEKTEIDKEPE